MNFGDNAAQFYLSKDFKFKHVLVGLMVTGALKSERFIFAHNLRLCMLAGAYSMDKYPVLKSWTRRRDGVGREKGRGRKRE